MKQLKQMKEILTSAVQGQLGNLSQANTEELGCAIDMIKDLSEAIYYCSIVESMKDAQEEKEEMMKMMKYNSSGQQQQQPQSMMYFHERVREPYYDPMRDMDRDYGRMYYSGGNNNSNSSGGNNARGGGTRGYSEPTYMHERDWREGQSGQRRRTYMEAKEKHSDKNMHVKELDAYAQELMNDVLDMIHEASPEEKQLLKKKMAELSQKIV